jgi:hypothetical protein
MPEPENPPPLPAGAGDEKLIAARRAAVDLIRQAEDLEAEARDVRRRARARLKHYERLLAEYQGQMSVLDEEGVLDARPDLR